MDNSTFTPVEHSKQHRSIAVRTALLIGFVTVCFLGTLPILMVTQANKSIWLGFDKTELEIGPIEGATHDDGTIFLGADLLQQGYQCAFSYDERWVVGTFAVRFWQCEP